LIRLLVERLDLTSRELNDLRVGAIFLGEFARVQKCAVKRVRNAWPVNDLPDLAAMHAA
jgi:hypothetical protein